MAKRDVPDGYTSWVLVTFDSGKDFHKMPCRLPDRPHASVDDWHYAGTTVLIPGWMSDHPGYRVLSFRPIPAPRVQTVDGWPGEPAYDSKSNTLILTPTGRYAYRPDDADVGRPDSLSLGDLDDNTATGEDSTSDGI